MGYTIIDIAKMAGTSKSTVSRYLNGGKVKPATASAIDTAVRKLDFRLNVNARRLASNRTNVIGVVLDDITNPFYSEILSGIQGAAQAGGFTCTFYSSSGRMQESDYLRLFREGQADGLILGTFQVRDERQVRLLAAAEGAVVLIGDDAGNKNVNSVEVDNFQGTLDEVLYLASIGHRKIAYLRGPSNIHSANMRMKGFLEGMSRCGLDPSLVADTPWIVEGGYKATKSLLDREFTALIASNEYSAQGALTALRDAGMRVPEEVSLAGFDDGLFSRYGQPGLTSVRQPFKELGEMAARQLILSIANENTPKAALLLQPELIYRASTAAP